MPSIIEILENMITNKYRHQAEGGHLVLREADQPDFKLKAGVRQFAIRLDLPPMTGGLDAAFPFLNRSIVGLTYKCDLIVFVCRDREAPIVFLIELKSLQSGDYLLQLRSSREFVLYLTRLMELHGLGNCQPIIKGVLIKSRRIPDRGTTRQTNLRFENRNGLDVCECNRNRPLSLSDLVRAAT